MNGKCGAEVGMACVRANVWQSRFFQPNLLLVTPSSVATVSLCWEANDSEWIKCISNCTLILNIYLYIRVYNSICLFGIDFCYWLEIDSGWMAVTHASLCLWWLWYDYVYQHSLSVRFSLRPLISLYGSIEKCVIRIEWWWWRIDLGLGRLANQLNNNTIVVDIVAAGQTIDRTIELLANCMRAIIITITIGETEREQPMVKWMNWNCCCGLLQLIEERQAIHWPLIRNRSICDVWTIIM